MTRLEHAGRDPQTGRNRWVLHLLPLEESILAALPDQLEALLSDPDSNRRVIERLFPATYEDPAEERDNRPLLGACLLDERRELLGRVRSELGAAERDDDGMRLDLTPDSMDCWLRFINDVRLVLATDLGVDSNLGDGDVDLEHPDAPKYALLEYLSGIEMLLVEALGKEF